MKYNKFEDVLVWQAGIELTTKIFAITEDRTFRYKGDNLPAGVEGLKLV